MRIAIVIPVFNDWIALSRLIGEIETAEMRDDVEFALFVVDDGSIEPAVIDHPLAALRRIGGIEVIRLACNVGHQRAIAVGLVETCTQAGFDAALVMDSDGEDRPSDIQRLLIAAERNPGSLICAQRRHRPVGFLFRLCYGCYKLGFRLLTGSKIDFGNFCLIPREQVEVLISNSWLWNSLPGTLIRSRIPLVRVPCDRGRRYVGQSKMGFVALVLHGLSALAVYGDVVMVRLMLGSLVLGSIISFGIAWVMFEKIFTDRAIPGWATSAVGILTIIFFQAIMLFMISAISMISMRSIRVAIPKLDAPDFVLTRHRMLPRDAVKADAAV
jgi:glycosyltransferase involved in cell wall biosynthesis